MHTHFTTFAPSHTSCVGKRHGVASVSVQLKTPSLRPTHRAYGKHIDGKLLSNLSDTDERDSTNKIQSKPTHTPARKAHLHEGPYSKQSNIINTLFSFSKSTATQTRSLSQCDIYDTRVSICVFAITSVIHHPARMRHKRRVDMRPIHLLWQGGRGCEVERGRMDERAGQTLN